MLSSVGDCRKFVCEAWCLNHNMLTETMIWQYILTWGAFYIIDKRGKISLIMNMYFPISLIIALVGPLAATATSVTQTLLFYAWLACTLSKMG